jgi:hypothetical protein
MIACARGPGSFVLIDVIFMDLSVLSHCEIAGSLGPRQTHSALSICAFCNLPE